MSKKILFLAGLLSIFSFLSQISGINSFEVQEITDSNINTLVGDGKDKSWLLMFFLETCPYCKVAKESLDLLSKRGDAPLNSLNIGTIECSQNNWSCLRFNVTRVPYIVLIKDDLLFEFKSYVTEETLATFVTGEKIVESGLPIPEQMGFVNFISIILKESVNVLNEQIEEFIQKYLKLNLKWKPSYTVILLILVLVVIIILEYYVVYFCCSIGSTPKKKVDNKTNSGQSVEKTEQTENKEEINKEENQNNKQKSD